MPLLGKEKFVRQQLPDNTPPNEEVFYCKTTSEAFITYDQFFERQILCSSMVWTCAKTGRTGLTYDEALQSERTAEDMLSSFPFSIQIPVLYLMNYINESKIGSIVDMIYAFVCNRYFITEEIETIVNSKRKFNGKVFRVIAPTDSQMKNSSQTISFGIDPKLYNYEIIDEKNNRHTVGAKSITRTKGVLTKDKVRLFLKQHLNPPKRSQPMSVKESSKTELSLRSISWKNIFSGPEPNFEDQTLIVKTFNKDKQKAILNSKRNISDESNSSLNASHKSSASRKFDPKNNSKKRSLNSSSNSGKSSTAKTQKNSETNCLNERQKIREKAKQEKLEQKKLEREQKKRFEENMKEWNAKRDDLACDDLMPLPQPIPIKCKIPVNLFADSLLVLEFFHCFNNLFDLKSIFPLGITFDLMEQILFDVDTNGPFSDLIKVMLTSNVSLQEEEDNNSENNDRSEGTDDEDRHNGEEERIEKFVKTPEGKTPNYYHNWIQSHLGLNLSQLSLDAYNLTEVLRLYLLSSGAGPKPRSQFRGLYTSREDPAIEFVANNESLLSKLKSSPIFELSAEERLKIFHLLIHQMLSFIEFRGQIDDSFEEMSKLRKKIRDIQTEFNKWAKDKALKRFQNKNNSQNESQKSNESTDAQTSVPTAEQLEEYQREKTHKEEEMQTNCCEIRSQIRKLQACYGLKPIGFDRAFRRYWVFESLPGLFVQCMKPNTQYTDMPFGPCLEEPTPIESSKPNGLDDSSEKCDSTQTSLRDDSSTTSDKENETNSISTLNTGAIVPNSGHKSGHLSDLDRCTANIETCCVHGLYNTRLCPEWAFYHSSEHLNDLISSLNCRGFRESELMVALNRDRTVLTEYMSKCQPNKLNNDIPAPETNARRSQRLQEVFHSRKGKQSSSILTALREYLINLEDRIFTGSFAVVTQVWRKEWRARVDHKYSDKKDLIENFSKAILELTQSIRSMLLSAPLSGEENSVFQNWSHSLQRSWSLSALFLHLSILEQSIKWDKSALKAYCKICRRKCDAENMLLCDQCNRGHHTYCLQPALEAIPQGEWFCPDCCPKFKPQTPKKDKSFQKLSYDNYSEYDSSEYSEDSVDTQSMTSDEESSTSSNDIEMCVQCHQIDADLQLSCAKCHDYYHLSCANVKRITRSDWFCPKCVSNGSNEKKRRLEIIDINISDDSQSSETQNKRSKRSRYSQDFDYINETTFVEEVEERVTPNTSARRRCDKSSISLRTTLELDFNFGLCEDILKQLQRHNEGWLFRCRPNQAPNYNKVIKKYVDFGQLVSNLNQGKYNSNSQFFRDVLLMLNNALFYNSIDSVEHKSCRSLADYFEQLLREYGLDLNH